MRRAIARTLRAWAHWLAPGMPWRKAAWHYRCGMQASNRLVVKQAMAFDELEAQNRKQRLCIAVLIEAARHPDEYDIAEIDWEDVPMGAGFLGGKRGGSA